MSLRIVSLLPSATEIICALGLGERLVGVSHECDFPAEVVGLPTVTAPKLDPTRSGRHIDADIRALVSQGLGVYTVDAERLRDLAPDLIVTQDQCDVCAVSYSDVLEATRLLAGRDVRIVSLRPSRLDDVWRDVETVAEAAGVAERGREVAGHLRARIAALEARTRSLPRPRLACLEWLDPLMAAGNWVPDLAAAAGAEYRLAPPGSHSRTLAWQELVVDAADVLCAMPCGFSLARTLSELDPLLRQEPWRHLPAVRAGKLFAVDGNSYFNRPGPRLVESAEILAGIAHPDECGELVPEGAVVRLEASHAGASAGAS